MMMRVFALMATVPAGLAGTAAVAGGDSAPLSALAGLEPGQWDLRSRDPADASLRLCIRDFNDLLQVRHPSQACSRFVVEDRSSRVSVTYTCPRTGHGRTDIRVETPRLVQLTSQGVAEGRPFSLDMEGRRTGSCAPAAAHK